MSRPLSESLVPWTEITTSGSEAITPCTAPSAWPVVRPFWPKAVTVLSRPRASSSASSRALRKSLGAPRPKPATRLSPKAASSTAKLPPDALWISTKLPLPPSRTAPPAPIAPLSPKVTLPR